MPMQNIEAATIAAILFFASLMAYKSSFLRSKKIGQISLLQIVYLILVPGFVFTVIFSYLLDIIYRPLNKKVFLSDDLLIALLLISSLYAYGGVVIHAVSKTLSALFKKEEEKSLVFKANRYFHLKFSHNLFYIGATASATFFALLELNHLPFSENGDRIIFPVLNGILIGVALVASLILYKEKEWMELKFFFLSLWILFALFIYTVKPYIKTIFSYPFSLSLLTAFCLVAGFSLFVSVKRLQIF
jgi:hypothetical protein